MIFLFIYNNWKELGTVIGTVIGVILFFVLLLWMSSQHTFLSIIAMVIFILLIIIIFGIMIFLFIYNNWNEAKRNIEEKTRGQTKENNIVSQNKTRSSQLSNTKPQDGETPDDTSR